ncbi:MAG: PsbP-related protein [Euryarchaeota archaeon]
MAGYATYTNATAGIRIQYPSGWNAIEGGRSSQVVLFKAPGNLTQVAVMSSPAGKSSLEELHNTIISGLLNETSYNYTLVSTEKTTLAGMPAITSTLTATIGDVTVKQRYVTMEKGDQWYSLIFSGDSEVWSKYQNDFSNMTNSFAITS